MQDLTEEASDTSNDTQRLDELSHSVLHWVSSVETFYPAKNKRNSSLRIGSITSERLYHGLRFEGELFVLTPGNWESVLKYIKLDFLLIESCVKSVTGDFHLALLDPLPHSEINKIITFAKKKAIPTVFWNTQDSIYHRDYLQVSKKFDYIFCSDPKEVELLRNAGIVAEILLPAVQPAIFNPFSKIKKTNPLKKGVLFDGIADLSKFDYVRSLLERITTGYGLRIIDSNTNYYKSELEELSNFRYNIVGNVGLQERVSALRCALVAIFFDHSLVPPTTQRWMVLECLACKVPVLHCGELVEDDIRFGLVNFSLSKLSFLVELAKIFELPQYQNKCAHLGWREVNNNHTFSHRIRQICKTINVANDWEEFPSVSVTSQMYRLDKLENCIHTFSAQKYPNKEFIMDYGDYKLLEENAKNVDIKNDSITLVTSSEGMIAKNRVSNRISKANGEYCFFINGYDYYSDHYISDMMLYSRAVDIDVMVPPPGFFLFEDDGRIFQRKILLKEHSRLFDEDEAAESLKLINTTLAGKTSILRKYLCLHNTNTKGVVDTNIFAHSNWGDLAVYCCYAYNVIINQREEGRSSFYNIDTEKTKKELTLMPGESVGSLLHFEIPQKREGLQVAKVRIPKILYLGPVSFRQGVWQTRVKYIFPDLFESIFQNAEIYMLTGPVPVFAEEGIKELKERFNIVFHSISPKVTSGNKYDHWAEETSKCVLLIKPDVITNIFSPTLFGIVAARLIELVGARYVQRVPGDETAARIAMGILIPGSKEHNIELRKNLVACHYADAIITMSSLEQKRIQKQCVEKEKVKICIRGIELDRSFRKLKIDETINISRFLFVGRKSKEKGYDIIEKAAQLLEKEYPAIEFWFAGTFEKKRIGNRKYLGFISSEQLPALYNNVDALILSSRTEGMPQVVMEAMAMEIPCIVSRHIFESIFQDGQEAFLIETDPLDLKEKVIFVHTNPEVGRKVARKAREYAVENFDKVCWQRKYAHILLDGVVSNFRR